MAAVACRLIKPGHVIFMDGGTTHLALIRRLAYGLKATIITHSPSIAAALEHHLAIETILIGGRLFRHSMVSVGAETLEAISRMRADMCFLGVTGIHASEGLTTGDSEEAAVKRALVERAAETVVLATEDKLGAASAFRIVNVDKISALIVTSQGQDCRCDRQRERKGYRCLTSVPPALVVALVLAQHAAFAGRLDFQQIAVHRAHAVVEFLGQVIELHQLLRQVAPRIGEMQHAPVGELFFTVPLCHIEELQMIAEPAGAVTSTSPG